MDCQWAEGAPVRSVHVWPPSDDVWMKPPEATAAKRLPSDDDAMDCQLAKGAPVRSVHVWPPSDDV
jgi:hypothetical protein